MTKEKTCVQCDNKFLPNHNPNQQFCSDECAVSYRKNQRQAMINARPVRACPWCHGKFRACNYQIFCCFECRELYRKTEKHIFALNLARDRQDAEFAKLKEQGKNYVLPNREVDCFEN